MTKKDIFILLAAGAAVIGAAFNVEIQTPEEFYSAHPDAVTEDSDWVTLTVECRSIAHRKGYDKTLPENGVLIDGEKYVLTKDETVFEVISKAAAYQRLPLDHSGGRNIYITGIDGIYEFDFGAQSGWLYTVNGIAPDINCGEYRPKSGDEIVFKYVDTYYRGAGMS